MLPLEALPRRAVRAAVFAATAWLGLTFGHAACRVEEEPRVSTVSGHFLLGSSSLTLTLPNRLYSADPTIVYLEVAGSDFAAPPGFFVDAGSEKVKIRNGAALRLTPKRNVRLSFSLTTGPGERLCGWVTKIGTWALGPPATEEGFSDSGVSLRAGLSHVAFRKAGDPVLLGVGGRLAKESAEFSIDGLPATVLARTTALVILRDPHPIAGLRSIESQGFSIALPMVVLQWKLVASAPRGRPALDIQVLGRDRIALPSLPVRTVALYNYDPKRLQVLCGKPLDYGDPRIISLASDGTELAASCQVKVLQPGPPSLDAVFTEFRGLPFDHRTLLPKWRPGVSWPRLAPSRELAGTN